MAFKLADIFIPLTLDTSAYDKGISGAQSKAGAFGGVLTGIFQGIGQRLFSGIVSGLETVVSKMGDAVTASSNLNESINKTGVVFGDSAQGILDWSKTSDRALGLSQQKALEAASSFGALFVQMGQGRDKAAEMSEGLLQIASDLGSINNLNPDQVFIKLKAGLAGESEPLKSLNIFLNEHIVAQRAVKLGLAASTDAVSEQAKVMARYSLIVDQSKYAQGDFARTSGDLANAQRILAAQIENGSASLGNTFRPAITSITNALVDLAPTMFQYAQAAMDQFANGLAAGIRAILPVITTVRQLLAYWFAPGSPPRVAPDIDKWGAAAMGQFFKGFTSVDIKSAISGIGSAIENILRSDVSAGKGDEQGLVGRVLGSQSAIVAAVQEFKTVGSVSESTLQRIARSSGSAGGSIAALVKAYFDVQKASDAATRAQEQLNRVTEKYDAILSPLQGELDSVRAQQQKLADQQRLISARNTLANFDATEAEKQAARLEIQQISLEDQIATVEQQKKAETDKAQAAVDGAKKEQDAAQKKMDIAQATIDQQVKINNLLGEQRQLEERLAQQREADAKRAQAEAEQAARKAEQEAEKAQRLADQLHQAQLQYNLEISDTPGKIKLMEAELANTKVGSVEYYQILSQIHRLTVQYNNELEQAAKKAGALSGSDALGGLDTLAQKLNEDTASGKNLKSALDELLGPLPKASKSVTDLADKISGLVDKIGLLVGIDFSTWGKSNEDAANQAGTAWDHYGELSASANAKTQNSLDETVAKINNFVDIIGEIVNGDWAALWERYKAYALAAYSATDTETETKLNRWQFLFNLFQYTTNLTWSQYWSDWSLIISTGLGKATETIGGWLTSIETKITGFGTNLYNAGASLLDNFWDGLKSKWDEISTWFTDKLASLRAQLPFSEPKDPTSPLRGLAKSGAAMVEMVQSGIQSASLNINPLADALLPAGVTNNNSNSVNLGGVTINIMGNANREDVSRGVDDGLTRALRSRGL